MVGPCVADVGAIGDERAVERHGDVRVASIAVVGFLRIGNVIGGFVEHGEGDGRHRDSVVDLPASLAVFRWVVSVIFVEDDMFQELEQVHLLGITVVVFDEEKIAGSVA